MKKEYTEPMITVISLVANVAFAASDDSLWGNHMSKDELIFGEDS